MNIGQKLKLARDAVGYTLKKASKESDIGDSSISEFENGKREPKFSQLSKLAEVYRRTIEFFLTDEPVVENMMLWREKPDTEEKRKEVEARFFQLCEQYHNLEVCCGEPGKVKLPEPDITKPEQFDYKQVEALASKVLKLFSLGEIPGASLKQALEEKYYVKIFYLEFLGSAISWVSPKFGPAILLNKRNKLWRRNYDLAHELFHILTWSNFRTANVNVLTASAEEEKLADVFASRLLLPEESVRERISFYTDSQGQIRLEQLEDVAREFGVSLDALVYRIASLFKIKKEDTLKYLDATKKLCAFHKPRESDEPEMLPERYCALAQRALRDGNLSLLQFAKYMGISYKKAQAYITEGEDFTDEKISISVA